MPCIRPCCICMKSCVSSNVRHQSLLSSKGKMCLRRVWLFMAIFREEQEAKASESQSEQKWLSRKLRARKRERAEARVIGSESERMWERANVRAKANANAKAKASTLINVAVELNFWQPVRGPRKWPIWMCNQFGSRGAGKQTSAARNRCILAPHFWKGVTDGSMDGRMDLRTDRPSYWGVCTHLKIIVIPLKQSKISKVEKWSWLVPLASCGLAVSHTIYTLLMDRLSVERNLTIFCVGFLVGRWLTWLISTAKPRMSAPGKSQLKGRECGSDLVRQHCCHSNYCFITNLAYKEILLLERNYVGPLKNAHNSIFIGVFWTFFAFLPKPIPNHSHLSLVCGWVSLNHTIKHQEKCYHQFLV